MYMIFSSVVRQQRKSDVMTSFGHSTRSAIYYKADSHYKIHVESTFCKPKMKYRRFL
jgi:hypothetical protein